MKKITLSLGDAVQLESEIQALVSIKAPIKLKYDLTVIGLKLKAYTKAGREMIESLYKEHGKPDAANDKLLTIEGKPLEDYKTLLEQPVDELEFAPISIEAFDKLEIDFNCPVFFEKIIG